MRYDSLFIALPSFTKKKKRFDAAVQMLFGIFLTVIDKLNES